MVTIRPGREARNNGEEEAAQEPQERPDVYPVKFEKGPNREGMVHDYLPEGEDWVAKTNLDLMDPARIAALAHFDVYYPEVEELQDTIDTFLHVFLKGRTSVAGAGRDEYVDILMAMFGGEGRDEKTLRTAILSGLADTED